MAVEIQTIDPIYFHHKQIIHIVKILEKGGVILYPTDTLYGLAADFLNPDAVKKIIKIKKIDKHKLLSLVCSDLKMAGQYAHIPNHAYRIMKRVLPGKYTFILPASNEVPKSILNNRKTVGIRIPDLLLVNRIVHTLTRPILSSSIPKGDDDFYTDPHEIARLFLNDIELFIDGGKTPNIPSTVIDFTCNPARIARMGAGDVDLF